MEEQDQASIYTSEDDVSSYKMSARETDYFVKLRATNGVLFSGKRETSGKPWRAILKHMGLQDKMSLHQAEEKWEAMKKRHKDLKCPPDGVSVWWPYFSLMDDALAGRLEGSAPTLHISTSQHDCASSSVGDEEGNVAAAAQNRWLERDRALLAREAAMMQREKAMMERENMMMEREKAMMEREKMMMEREKTVIEREKTVMERETIMKRDMYFH